VQTQQAKPHRGRVARDRATPKALEIPTTLVSTRLIDDTTS
jgi:hypothetical protein